MALPTYEIEKIIQSIKTTNTTGYNEISNHIIKLSAPYIISPLTHICNAALEMGVFSNRLKFAIVRPIHNNGNKHDVSNYRPISLLTSFSKVFEKLICNRIYRHLEMSNILSKQQFGFRAKYSMEQAAFPLINSILATLNNQIAGGIFCDLLKAFDCVNHKILLDKLQVYGIHGKLNMLIQSYFTNRYQKVTYNNNSSSWERINCGVPQGSILGPLFFFLYINDIPTVISDNNNMVLYADDTSFIITDKKSENFNSHANMIFNNINIWFRNNLLHLNLSKTHYLEFRNMKQRKIKGQIHYNHNYITNATHIKFHGLIIDDMLSCNQHIDQVTRKLSSATCVLRHTKSSLPIDTLKIIHFAYVHTTISYGIIFWGNSFTAKNVFLFQKKILRIIANKQPRDSCKVLLKDL